MVGEAARLDGVAVGVATFRWLRVVPMVAMGGMLLAIALAGPAFTERFAAWPFLISFLLLGMPHGAMDLWAAGRLRPVGAAATAGPPTLFAVSTWLAALGTFGGYLLWMTVSLAAVLAVPDLAAGLFFVLTMVHWGLGDQWATQRAEMRIAPGVAMAGCFILARGCLVLGPAFAHDPAGAWAPFAAIASYGTAFFGSGSIVTETAILGPVGIALTSVGVVAAIVAAAWRWRHDGARGAGLDLVEHALVAALCLVASPLFAVGCYFLLVHSWRHAVRLGTTPEMVGSDAASRPAIGLLRVHLLSLPLLVPTGVICLLAAWRLEAPPSAFSIVAAMIAFFMISTLPHHLLGLKLPGQRPARRHASADLHDLAAPDPT